MGEGRLAYLPPKCRPIIRLSKECFPVFRCCAIWLRQHGKWGHSQVFSVKFGAISPSAQKWGDEATNPITGY